MIKMAQLPLVSKSKNVVSWLLGWDLSLVFSIISFSIKVSVDPLISIVIKFLAESLESSISNENNHFNIIQIRDVKISTVKTTILIVAWILPFPSPPLLISSFSIPERVDKDDTFLPTKECTAVFPWVWSPAYTDKFFRNKGCNAI